MKVRINYHSISYGAHVFATPDFTNSEIVEVSSLNDEKLKNYIESKKDDYGHPFKKEEIFGFDYTSHAGGVKVEIYNEPNIKVL